MRIKMLETVNTVGQILEYDKVYEIDAPLADALIERGQAEDPFVSQAPKPAAPTFVSQAPKPPDAEKMMRAVRPMVSPVEMAHTGTLAVEPVEKPKPAKKAAAKKPAAEKKAAW